MPTLLTTAAPVTPIAPAARSTGPNRYPPQPESTPPEERFATLLQQRQAPVAQAPKPEPKPAAKPPAGSKGEPSAQPKTEPKGEAKTEPAQGPSAEPPAAPDAETEATTDRFRPVAHTPGGKLPVGITPTVPCTAGPPAIDVAPEAPTSGTPAKLPPQGTTPPQPATGLRDIPIVEEPMLPPAAAGDTPTLTDGTTPDEGTGVDAAGKDPRDTSPATSTPSQDRSTDPAFWPGISLTPAVVATMHPEGTPVAGGGAGRDALPVAVACPAAPAAQGTPTAHFAHASRIAGSAALQTASGPVIARTGTEAEGESRGRQGSDAANALANAKPDAAAAQSELLAAINAAGERFALPPRAPAPDSAPPLWAGGALPPQRADVAPAPAAVALPTPLSAPDFAKALAAQVSVFTRDGLAQAELQLTPAEMGPVRVHITVDGAHARVDFAADSAATRQVIERGLPELASALREQGLTLSGGGVFQRAPDQRQDGQASNTGTTRGAGRRGGEAIEATGAAPAARARALAAQRGGVDLYA